MFGILQMAAKQPPPVPTGNQLEALFMLMIHARASSPDHASLPCPGTCTECMFHKFETPLTGFQIINPVFRLSPDHKEDRPLAKPAMGKLYHA